jgi:cytochrome c oxidase subunit IV
MAHAHSGTHAGHSQKFDELDPHGASGKGARGQHAAHVIVGPLTLRSVLAVLLFFTVLTVAQARLEIYLTHALDMEFPRWVNIAFCMGIAVIKALLVMGFFMQLKYDNPINSVVMAFTFLGLALFLGFTALDLTGRGSVYTWKTTYREPGGTLLLTKKAKDNAIVTMGGIQRYEKIKAIILHEHPEHLVLLNSPQVSRGKSGLSGALDTAATHEAGHDAHAETPPATPAH